MFEDMVHVELASRRLGHVVFDEWPQFSGTPGYSPCGWEDTT